MSDVKVQGQRKRHEHEHKHKHNEDPCDGLCDKEDGLAWNRINLTIPPFTTLAIDTGIKPSDRDCPDPILAVTPTDTTDIPPFTDETGVFEITTLVPIPGTTPASRVMVIPLPPIAPWVQVTLPTEPYLNPQTGTVIITLANGGLLPVQLNLLVWDPSCANGPGEADVYANMPDVTSPINNPTP